MGSDRMPERATGLIPLAVGALGLLATAETSSGTEYSLIDWAFGPVLIGIGLGLFFSQRWAWALALLAGAGGVVVGVMGATSPGDIAARALIHDQADRDAIASQLMRYHDENGQGWADIIDLLPMYPDARRRVMRALGEVDG